MFKEFVSNTALALGKSYLIEKTNGVLRQRTYIKPTLYGRFEWKFYFQNSVNSTFAQGEISHAGTSGGNWVIHKASISVSPSLDPSDAVTNVTAVTFDSQESRRVLPDEEFWSDTVDFEINDGYIVWEWEIEGENIPSMPEDISPPTHGTVKNGRGNGTGLSPAWLQLSAITKSDLPFLATP